MLPILGSDNSVGRGMTRTGAGGQMALISLLAFGPFLRPKNTGQCLCGCRKTNDLILQFKQNDLAFKFEMHSSDQQPGLGFEKFLCFLFYVWFSQK